MALVVAAILMGFAFPKLTPMRETSNLRSAKQLLTTHLTTARQAAIRRGVEVRFSVSGNSIVAKTLWNGDSVTVSPATNMYDQYGATLTARNGITSITYNSRGFAYPRIGATERFVITRGVKSDSICVSPLGMIAKCGL